MGQDHHVATAWASGTVLTAARLNNLEAQYDEFVANFPAPQIGTFYVASDLSISAGVSAILPWAEETDPDNVYSVSSSQILLPGAGLYTGILRTTWKDLASTGKTGETNYWALRNSSSTVKARLGWRGLQNTSGYDFSYLMITTFYVDSGIAGPRVDAYCQHSVAAVNKYVKGGADYTWLHLARRNRA